MKDYEHRHLYNGYASYMNGIISTGTFPSKWKDSFLIPIFKTAVEKMAKLGFGGSFLAWIGSYLTGRKEFMEASGSQFKRFSVRSNVSQGSH
jgi:hypothetical protein